MGSWDCLSCSVTIVTCYSTQSVLSVRVLSAGVCCFGQCRISGRGWNVGYFRRPRRTRRAQDVVNCAVGQGVCGAGEGRLPCQSASCSVSAVSLLGPRTLCDISRLVSRHAISAQRRTLTYFVILQFKVYPRLETVFCIVSMLQCICEPFR